ncbi:hypothetical protein D3C80_443680 [compost metagenome]
MTTGFTVRCGKTSLDDQGQQADPGFQLALCNIDRRQIVGKRTFLEGLASRFCRLLGVFATVQHGGHFGREDLLDFVDLRTSQHRKPCDLVHRQRRVKLEEARNIGILGIAPVLPEIIGRQHVGVQPDSAVQRLAHLGARSGRQKWRGQRVELRRAHPVTEIDAVDDIAPLIRAAHLQTAVVTLVQLYEVVSLQDHVVEFEEGQRLLPVKARLDAVEGQHAVDREMATDIPQEFKVVDLAQPVAVVDHHGILSALPVGKVIGEDALDRGDVAFDRVDRHQLAGIVLERRIPDHAGAAAHQRDRPVTGLLHPVQHHDLDKSAGMKRRRRRVEADIGRHGFLGEQFVETCLVGDLVNEAALIERAKEIGLEPGHLSTLWMCF